MRKMKYATLYTDISTDESAAVFGQQVVILSNITSSICLEEHFCHNLHHEEGKGGKTNKQTNAYMFVS